MPGQAAARAIAAGPSFSTMVLPFSTAFLPDEIAQSDEGRFCKAMVNAPVDYDPDHYLRLKKATGAQSYLDDSYGGALVGPPQMGELLPLIRNRSALDRAGAQMMPLPPNGKLVLPKETGTATAYWVPENNQTSIQSRVTFGQVSSQAKKLMALVVLPNEMAQFTGGAGEAVIRNNLTQSIALAYDYAGLYGEGANGQPKGLVYHTATGELIDYAAQTPAPAGIGANGNAVKAEDFDAMIGLVEDRNFDADEDGFAWVMRSKLYRRAVTIGADAVTAGDERTAPPVA